MSLKIMKKEFLNKKNVLKKTLELIQDGFEHFYQKMSQ